MNSPERNWESIWSIPLGWRTAYFAAFGISNLAATCVIAADEIANREVATPLQVFSAIAERVAVAGVAIAITIVSIVEVLYFAMVTGNYIRQKFLEPLKESQREEGRKQGEEKANAEWSAWNQRRLKAEANGEPFDEPAPDQS